MKARFRAGIAVGALAAALCAPGVARSAPRQPRLQLEAPRWAIAGRAVEIVVEKRGALADRKIQLVISVDTETVDRFVAAEPRVRHRFRHELLSPGRHVLEIRSGTEVARASIRILPAWTLWAGALGTLAVLLVGTFVVLSRRRRPTPARAGPLAPEPPPADADR